MNIKIMNNSKNKGPAKSFDFAGNPRNNLAAILEAILFVSTEEESIEKLAQITNVKAKDIKETLAIMKKDCLQRGIMILEHNDKIQMVTNPKYASWIQKYQQKDLREDLSLLALETLAIIAYKGPLSRYQIEEIRGVNSVFVLRNLLRRGLVERKIQGKKIEYQITTDFLRHLGLTQASELPKYNEFKEKESGTRS